MEEVDALKEAFLVGAFHTLDAQEVALDAVVVAFRKDPSEEGQVEDLHTS